MNWLRWLLSYFSLLSLDVVLGAVAGMYFFSALLHLEISVWIYLLLALAVWVIYIGDHLLDIRKSKESQSSRRQFYHRYSRILTGIVGLNLFIGLVLSIWVFQFGSELFLSIGLGLIILATMIFLRQKKRLAGWLKELTTAIFYVLGIAWIPLLRVEQVDFPWEPVVFILLYIGVAWLNLLMLSYLDRHEDRLQGFLSLAQMITPERLFGLIRKLALVLILISLLLFLILPSFYRPFACILLLMAGFHYLSFFSKKGDTETKRRQMEWYFFLPALLFFI